MDEDCGLALRPGCFTLIHWVQDLILPGGKLNDLWLSLFDSYLALGRDSAVGIATGCGLDGPGIESRRGDVFRSVQTGSGAHRTSCAVGIWSFPRVNR
jgi:hypothetical protein